MEGVEVTSTNGTLGSHLIGYEKGTESWLSKYISHWSGALYIITTSTHPLKCYANRHLEPSETSGTTAVCVLAANAEKMMGPGMTQRDFGGRPARRQHMAPVESKGSKDHPRSVDE